MKAIKMNRTVLSIIFLIFLICFMVISLIFGCAKDPIPVQVKGQINLGDYKISPPKDYWYFPQRTQCENNIINENGCMITFFENKESALVKISPVDEKLVFFNFGILANNFKKYEDYYNAAKSHNITYVKLPKEASVLESISNWSCKQENSSIYGIECISLGKNLLTVVLFGPNKSNVLKKIPELKKMIESIN